MCYARLPWRFGRALSASSVRADPPLSRCNRRVRLRSGCFGVSALRESGWADAVALGTELEVQVREPPTCHRITVQQIHRWCDGVAVSPDETLKKGRLKQYWPDEHV
jgi:hypothetical protein